MIADCAVILHTSMEYFEALPLAELERHHKRAIERFEALTRLR